MHGKSFPLLTGILLFLWGMPFLTADIVVRFPTENTALLDNRPQDFYMYVDRNFEGKKSQPWEAGAYGFTRTLVRTQAGPVAVKFHEGIDIKPLRRDASGTPLDDVHPVAGGTVVHASANPTHSNYGRYVVIEHQLKDGPLYSLYAHLASVSCRKGDRVGTVEVVGGEKRRVEVLAAEDFDYSVAPEEHPCLALPGPGFIYAPAVEGADAGVVYVLIEGKAVGKVPVVYGATIEQAQPEEKSFWQKLFHRGSG